MRSVWMTLLSFFALPALAGPHTINGFRPFINLTGFDGSYTYVPLDANGNLKPEYEARLDETFAKGYRFMDWQQTVASSIANWSDRPLTDFTHKGVSYETIFKVTNKQGVIPWLNIPDLANDAFAYEFGKLAAQKLDKSIKVVKVERGNEYWNGGDQMQGTANLLRARANPYLNQYSDTEKMARQAAIDGKARIAAFRKGFADAGGTATVEWIVGGFSPNQYFAQWQLDELQKQGVNLKTANIRTAVANYAPGSPTDVNISPTESFSSGLNKLKAFIDVNAQWNTNNKLVADYYGILGLDIYEARAGSSGGITTGAMLDWWINFNKSAEARDLQRYFWKKVTDSVGVNAAINVEGIYGIPYSQYGQFPLMDINELSTGSPSYNGLLDTVDFSAVVPEPGVGLCFAALAYGLFGGRRARRAA